MAEYADLEKLRHDADLLGRVVAACGVSAEAIRNESDQTEFHTARLRWAASVFRKPESVGREMLGVLLSANKDATVDAIKTSTDAVLQTAVDGAVNFFATRP